MYDIIFIDSLEKGKPIISNYYIGLLQRVGIGFDSVNHVKTATFEEGYQVASKQCDISQINEMVKVHKLKLELLPQPSYSPNLTPNGFFLTSLLKKMLAL